MHIIFTCAGTHSASSAPSCSTSTSIHVPSRGHDHPGGGPRAVATALSPPAGAPDGAEEMIAARPLPACAVLVGLGFGGAAAFGLGGGRGRGATVWASSSSSSHTSSGSLSVSFL